MKAQPTMYLIIKTLKDTTANALSAKGLAEAANIDQTSENLQWITDELFDLVDCGKAIVIRPNGTKSWFFNLIQD